MSSQSGNLKHQRVYARSALQPWAWTMEIAQARCAAGTRSNAPCPRRRSAGGAGQSTCVAPARTEPLPPGVWGKLKDDLTFKARKLMQVERDEAFQNPPGFESLVWDPMHCILPSLEKCKVYLLPPKLMIQSFIIVNGNQLIL